jgi:hypothetical protein
LYTGNLSRYSRWLAGPPYFGDGRLAATQSSQPSWLAHYRKYNPDALLT